MATPSPDAVARTYSHPSYDDPWNAVEDHRRVIAYVAEHPTRGSQAIATALDLPRGRIRPWLEDGAMPDGRRTITVAGTPDRFVRDLVATTREYTDLAACGEAEWASD